MTRCSATQETSKLLHIRQKGMEYAWGEDKILEALRQGHGHNSTPFEELSLSIRFAKLTIFVRCVFGDDRFPNLQVLALGDFSYENRYHETSILLCKQDPKKNGQNFRAMDKEDICLFENKGLLDFDFLSACPRAKLFHLSIAKDDDSESE